MEKERVTSVSQFLDQVRNKTEDLYVYPFPVNVAFLS
jgi:hypothetical protein